MELRPATHDEFEEYSRALLSAFHRESSEEGLATWGPLFEPDRSLTWRDNGRIVATAGSFGRELTVPGGRAVHCAGVTAVGVRATHRRRGLLTAMMHRQLEDLRERGEAVAGLWASEGAIYGRFGYGMATRHAALRARRPRAQLAVEVVLDESLTAAPAGDLVDAMAPVYDRVRRTRPGMFDRSAPWWPHRLFDPERDRDGAQPLQAALTDGGYAIYAVKPDMDRDFLPAGEVRVRELVTETAAARAALWAFLLDQDLTATVTYQLAAPDDSLMFMLTDPRALRMELGEALWVRLVDVPAAIAARSYASDPDVVLDVADAFCPWNEGRYRLSADDCERTETRADIAVGVAELGAAYLGGTTLRSLADAGRVRELSPGAVARASDAFRGDVEPWCPEVF